MYIVDVVFICTQTLSIKHSKVSYKALKHTYVLATGVVMLNQKLLY